MSNSNFGKQIENARKYKDTRIANNDDKAKKIATKVTFNEWHILSENFTQYDLRKPNVLLDKPIIIGFTILEIAKLEMNIHYDGLKQIFGDNLQLLYTDTDSLKLSIKNTNPYELDDRLKDYIDTSNFSVDTIFPLEPGKKEKCFGSLKFENGECARKEFNAKAPKTFEEKRSNQLKSVKAKGLKRGFKKYNSDSNFKSVTLYEKSLRIIQKQIKSKNFNMTMENVDKDVIRLISNKRELFLGLSVSFPWGCRGKKYILLLSTFRNNTTFKKRNR